MILKICQLSFSACLFFFGCFFSRGVTVMTRYEVLREPLLSPGGNISLQHDKKIRSPAMSLQEMDRSRPSKHSGPWSLEDRAGWASRLTFWWLNPLFVIGYK